MKGCYVTLATNQNYLIGATYLYETYLKMNSKYPFLLLVTSNLSEEELYIVKDIPHKIVPYKKFEDLEGDIYEDTINKFYLYDLKEYDLILFVDADVLLFGNLDYLFEELPIKEGFLYCHAQDQESTRNVSGGFFLVHPKDYDSKMIFDNYSNRQNDEQVLVLLYPVHHIFYCQTLPVENAFNVYYHDGGSKKYWNFIKIPPKVFLDNDIIKIYNILGLWSDVKGKF